MHIVDDMLSTHPRSTESIRELRDCILACFECVVACTACADACLAEAQPQMLNHCIRLNLDCADQCAATGRMLSRQTEPDWSVVRAGLAACAVFCEACARECDRHAAMHKHCLACAAACRKCMQLCRELTGRSQVA